MSEPATRELKAPLGTTARENCPACAAPLAPDQRYCVECGQRLAQARPPFMGAQPEPASAPGGTPPKRSRFGMTPNSTLIAGIGVLLLAMGVGVLIGRSGQSSNNKKDTATPIVTVPSTGAVTTATSTSASAGTSGESKPASASKAAANSAAAKAASSSAASESAKGAPPKPSAAAAHPANPTVKLGQKGSGKGYQHGKFTGHFFGGENEEEAGEEGAANSTKK